jgi:hypothetical protein
MAQLLDLNQPEGEVGRVPATSLPALYPRHFVSPEATGYQTWIWTLWRPGTSLRDFRNWPKPSRVRVQRCGRISGASRTWVIWARSE